MNFAEPSENSSRGERTLSMEKQNHAILGDSHSYSRKPCNRRAHAVQRPRCWTASKTMYLALYLNTLFVDSSARTKIYSRSQLPGRPVLLQHCSVADNDCPAATPLDLDDLHETLARFRSQLIDSCVESEESEEHNGNDEDISVVMSRERMNEEYMFRLARSKDFGPKNCVI